MKFVTPSTGLTAFNCPHCGVLTTQYWYGAFAEKLPKDQLPYVVRPDDDRDFSFKDIENEGTRKRFLKLVEDLKRQRPFFYKGDRSLYDTTHVYNLNFSICYECSQITVWIFDSIVYPQKGDAPPPNPDLPPEIEQDYREASSILHLSPRGAAALIRLAIQKLCEHLGQPGQNINSDIKALVAAGLDVRIQKALDAVRVIGNSAVHPGSMDLRDDRATAESLFRLLNLIAEKMISEPKHVDEVYAALPPGALAAIEKRDKPEK